MNHISTLTITKQYIENRIRQVNRQNTDDVLQVVMAMMAAVDERFKSQEQAMDKVSSELKRATSRKDLQLGA